MIDMGKIVNKTASRYETYPYQDMDATAPAPASFIDRIQISIDRIRKLTASVDLAADTLHGPVPTGIGSANQITMGAPAESVTKKIIDLADAVDMLERAVNRVGENI